MEWLKAGNVGVVVVVVVVVAEVSLEPKICVSNGPVIGMKVGMEDVRSSKNVSKTNTFVCVKDNTHGFIEGEIFGQVGIFVGILWGKVRSKGHFFVPSVESLNGRTVMEVANLITPSSTVSGIIVDNIVFGDDVDKDWAVAFVALFGCLKHVVLWVVEITSVGGTVRHENFFSPVWVVLHVVDSLSHVGG